MKGIVLSLSAISLYFLVFSVSVGTSSCEKDPTLVHDTTKVTVRDTIEVCPSSIVGLWIGTYTDNGLPNDPARYFSFVIKPDGTLIVESKPLGSTSAYGFGTWTLNGNILTCNYVYPSTVQGYAVSQSATATYDKTNSKLISGTWTDNGAPNGSGKFSMNEVK